LKRGLEMADKNLVMIFLNQETYLFHSAGMNWNAGWGS
jgi:hypothetical protein